jgi:HSP20 family protein
MYRNIIQPKVINGFFDDLLHNGIHKVWNEAENLVNNGHAPVNIQETDKGYELSLIAPGLSKEAFKVNIDKNILSISYQQPEEKATPENEVKWLRKEFKQRSFKRSFTLSEKTDANGITAKYADGILVLNLPKKDQVEEKATEITVG